MGYQGIDFPWCFFDRFLMLYNGYKKEMKWKKYRVIILDFVCHITYNGNKYNRLRKRRAQYDC